MNLARVSVYGMCTSALYPLLLRFVQEGFACISQETHPLHQALAVSSGPPS